MPVILVNKYLFSFDRSLVQWKMFRNRFIELFAIVKFRCVWQSCKTYAVLPVSSKIRTIVNWKWNVLIR